MLYQLSYTHHIKCEDITGVVLFCKRIYPKVFFGSDSGKMPMPKEVFDAPLKLSYI